MPRISVCCRPLNQSRCIARCHSVSYQYACVLFRASANPAWMQRWCPERLQSHVSASSLHLDQDLGCRRHCPEIGECLPRRRPSPLASVCSCDFFPSFPGSVLTFLHVDDDDDVVCHGHGHVTSPCDDVACHRAGPAFGPLAQCQRWAPWRDSRVQSDACVYGAEIDPEPRGHLAIRILHPHTRVPTD